MSNIVPIPTTRVSGLLLRQRLTQQYQADQLDLFRLQEQISTGQRIVLPSDDAPAALRAISLQRLLERKGQFETNINNGQIFLAATDTALDEVAKVLNDVKSATLGAVSNVAAEGDRTNAIDQINKALDALVSIGNRQALGRYLFAGSQTSTQPYTFDENNSVVYHGDDKSIQSYSDLGVLFASNATGLDVFGGISEAVKGTTDLNPQLSANTLLSSINGGNGISPNGSITISDGNNTSTVDLSNANTIGDVIRLIENNPPPGHQVDVSVSGSGLVLQLDDGTSNIIIGEVGTGTVARELGILEPNGVLVKTGEDLNPKLLKTTRLDDLLGTKARAALRSGADGDNNDILVTATANGTAFDGATIQFVDNSLLTAAPGISAGNEFAEYDTSARAATAALTFQGLNNDLILTANTAGSSFNDVRIDVTATASGGVPEVNYNTTSKVLTINLEADGTSDANQIITAIAGIPGTPFTATLDTDPAADPTNDGSGTIAAFNQTSFGSTGSSGGDANTLYIHIDSNQTTANQAIEAINAEGTFSAELDQADSSSSVEAGTGRVIADSATSVTTSGGSGTSLDLASGLRITNGDETFDIAFDQAVTVEDFLNTLNSSEAGLKAEINADGNGINIRSRLSGNPIQIGELGGQTATQLGLRTFTEETKLSALNYGVGVPTAEGFKLPTADGNDFTIETLDGLSFDVDLSSVGDNQDLTATEAINEIVNLINTASANAGASVTASAVTTGNVTAIQIDDAGIPTGTDPLTVTSATGSLAAQYLGIIPNGDTQVVSAGTNITGDDSNYIDLTINANGQTFGIDLSDAKTVDDVLTAINTASGGVVEARLAENGNGIELIDRSPVIGTITVTAVGSSQAAEYLGLADKTEIGTTRSSDTGILTGEDRHFQETESVFNTLISLRDALEQNDLPTISRIAEKLDTDIDRVVFARADVGARAQGLDIAEANLQQEEIQLRAALSEEIDVDLVEAISQLTARQISLEASLRATANILQLSLLNFI